LELLHDNSVRIRFRVTGTQPRDYGSGLGIVLVGVVPKVDAHRIVPEKQWQTRPRTALDTSALLRVVLSEP
jgi:hypothetical protein